MSRVRERVSVPRMAMMLALVGVLHGERTAHGDSILLEYPPDGLIGGANLGAGVMLPAYGVCSVCKGLTFGGWSGWKVANRFGLVGYVQIMGSVDNGNTASGQLGGGVQFWPWTNLWFIGTVGIGFTAIPSSVFQGRYNIIRGGAVSLVLGYDVAVTSRQGRVHVQVGMTRDERMQTLALSIGFHKTGMLRQKRGFAGEFQ